MGRESDSHPPSCSGAAPPGLCPALPRLCPAAPLGEGEVAFRAVLRLSSFPPPPPLFLPPLLKNIPPPLQPPFLMLLASLRGCRQAPPPGRQERCAPMVLGWVFFFYLRAPEDTRALSRVGEPPWGWQPCTNSLSGVDVPPSSPIPRWKCLMWSKHSWYLGNKTPARTSCRFTAFTAAAAALISPPNPFSGAGKMGGERVQELSGEIATC